MTTPAPVVEMHTDKGHAITVSGFEDLQDATSFAQDVHGKYVDAIRNNPWNDDLVMTHSILVRGVHVIARALVVLDEGWQPLSSVGARVPSNPMMLN